ncbi:MAG: hypothetical protein AVDCRST_MAG25-2444 [uncultured Rubrobacteraceae bacterium]|uniref:Uncharacterized protein n=1 Tax=uncultured Rubrobacteraceae bacterium TaxID=349277 RepID=A0A6J4RRW8_9ACTN|nr:MAG: hypothetical protein AVDCRST_MAG25-2444 [uncultured Rubrobacteraceae bacterium]
MREEADRIARPMLASNLATGISGNVGARTDWGTSV